MTYCYAHGWQDWCYVCPPSGFPDLTADLPEIKEAWREMRLEDARHVLAVELGEEVAHNEELTFAYGEGWEDAVDSMHCWYFFIPRPLVFLNEWWIDNKPIDSACTGRTRDDWFFHLKRLVKR